MYDPRGGLEDRALPGDLPDLRDQRFRRGLLDRAEDDVDDLPELDEVEPERRDVAKRETVLVELLDLDADPFEGRVHAYTSGSRSGSSGGPFASRSR